MINFSSYLIPYLIILVATIFSVTIISLNLFDSESYLESQLQLSTSDSLLKYAVSSFQVIFVSNWGEVNENYQLMDRCIYYYGIHVALFFIGIAIIMKFVVENCMVACFIFIYNSLYWDLIKEDSSQIYLNFDKTTREKKNRIQRSIFSRNSTINKLSSHSAPQSPEMVFGKTKNISNFLYINRAIKHFKGKRGAPNVIRPQLIPSPIKKAESKILDDPELENISEYYHGDSPSPTIKTMRQDSPFKSSDQSYSHQDSIKEKPESYPNMPFEIEVLGVDQTSSPKASKSILDQRESNSFQGEIPPISRLAKDRGISKSFHLDKEFVFPHNKKRHGVGIENEETTAKEKSDQLFLPLDTEANNLVEPSPADQKPEQTAVPGSPVELAPATPTHRVKKNKILPRRNKGLRKMTTSRAD